MTRLRRLAFAALCVASATGCSVFTQDTHRHDTPSRTPPPASAVAQFGFGDNAWYEVCVFPNCPMVTAKHAVINESVSEVLSIETRECRRRTDERRQFDRPPRAGWLTICFLHGSVGLSASSRRLLDGVTVVGHTPLVRLASHLGATGTLSQRQRMDVVARYIATHPKLQVVRIVRVEILDEQERIVPRNQPPEGTTTTRFSEVAARAATTTNTATDAVVISKQFNHVASIQE